MYAYGSLLSTKTVILLISYTLIQNKVFFKMYNYKVACVEKHKNT